MDTINSASPIPAPEAKDPASLFEDELILSAPAVTSSGSGQTPAGAPLVPAPRGRAPTTRVQKQTQSSEKLAEERKRYHINTVK